MSKIKVYTTPTCTYCIILKKYLQEKGVEYEEINVSDNEEAQKEMVEKTGQLGVPVVDIDGELIVGFDKEKIDKKLEI